MQLIDYIPLGVVFVLRWQLTYSYPDPPFRNHVSAPDYRQGEVFSNIEMSLALYFPLFKQIGFIGRIRT